MDEYIGVVKLFANNFAPRGWMLCQGQILAIAPNTALFSLLGTTYGGNGQTTFALPDLRGRAAIGAGQGPGLQAYQLGQVGGFESTTLTTNQMPLHTHAISGAITAVLSAESKQADAQNPANKCLASGTSIYATPDAGANRQMDPTCITVTNTLANGPAGGGQPFAILSPYLCLNYAICTEGLFPPRN